MSYNTSLKLDVLIEDMERYYDEPINLPRYKCRCIPHLSCPFCDCKRSLSYSEAMEVWGVLELPLALQIPQCHICSRFESDDNPLFAYAILQRNDDYKFIYRCLKGHYHDHGMTLVDLKTGLEVHL